MSKKLLVIDGVAWQVEASISGGYYARPICPSDRMELDSDGDYYAESLECPDCEKKYKIPRNLSREKSYVIEKYKASLRQDWDLVDIDGTLTPVTKKEKKSKDGYFCTSQVRDSKRGPQVVIYAGKKGQKGKSQIFVTPEERRLSFDQNDINPVDVFTRITAEFRDGTRHILEGGSHEN